MIIDPTPFHDDRSSRLGLTLVLALLVHAALVVGIRFQSSPPAEVRVPTLKVSLVVKPNSVQPDAEVPAAAADHLGGGESSKQAPETEAPSPDANITTDALPGTVLMNSQAAQQVQAKSDTQEATNEKSTTTTESSATAVIDTTVASETTSVPEPQTEPTRPALATATELMRQARQLARVAPASALPISRGDAPKSHGASTRYSQAEAYIEDWVRKVQDWGTRNFPDVARQLGSKGQLRLSVVLRYDGRIQAITLLQSSGNSELDQAAVDIVELAAPYAPFSQTLRDEYGDFLTIDRNWQFVQGNRLTSR